MPNLQIDAMGLATAGDASDPAANWDQIWKVSNTNSYSVSFTLDVRGVTGDPAEAITYTVAANSSLYIATDNTANSVRVKVGSKTHDEAAPLTSQADVDALVADGFDGRLAGPAYKLDLEALGRATLDNPYGGGTVNYDQIWVVHNRNATDVTFKVDMVGLTGDPAEKSYTVAAGQSLYFISDASNRDARILVNNILHERTADVTSMADTASLVADGHIPAGYHHDYTPLSVTAHGLVTLDDPEGASPNWDHVWEVYNPNDESVAFSSDVLGVNGDAAEGSFVLAAGERIFLIAEASTRSLAIKVAGAVESTVSANTALANVPQLITDGFDGSAYLHSLDLGITAIGSITRDRLDNASADWDYVWRIENANDESINFSTDLLGISGDMGEGNYTLAAGASMLLVTDAASGSLTVIVDGVAQTAVTAGTAQADAAALISQGAISSDYAPVSGASLVVATTAGFLFDLDVSASGGYVDRLTYGSGTGWQLRAMADVNGDGVEDAVMQNASGHFFTFDHASATRTDVGGAGLGWQAVDVVHSNAGSADDLLFKSNSGAYFLLQEGQTASRVDLGGGGQGWQFLESIDMDGNGRDELIFRHC